LVCQAQAITDIAEGELLWLQGFDGNPATSGFRVEGTLLLRSVDDIAHIGINLNSGAITNAPTGTIRVEVGVSGNRFINGSVLNQGQFKVDSSLAFPGANTFFLNTGTFTVGETFVARFFGQKSQFTQQDGLLSVGAQGFEFYDGTFAYTGGAISGQPLFFRTQVTYATADDAPFQPRLIGPGGSFRGPLGPNLFLRILGASGQGGDTAVTLEEAGALRGRMELGQYFGGSNVRVVAAGGSLTVAATGSLTVKPTGGGAATLVGNLINDGTLSVSAGFAVANGDTTATNRATLTMQAGGNLQFAGGFRHEAGALNLHGATLGAAHGVTLAGPEARLAGVLQAAVTNETTLSLSQNDGELVVTGSWVNDPAATLKLELSEGGLLNPLLTITGVLNAAGALPVTLLSGFEPQLGDTFPLFKMQSLTGQFRPFTLPPLPAGRFWELLRAPTNWTLVVRDQPPAPRLKLTFAEGLPTIAVLGTPGRSATLYGSLDLQRWESIRTEAPFKGEFSVVAPDMGSDSPRFFRGEIEP
jgi:hypothetical protein